MLRVDVLDGDQNPLGRVGREKRLHKPGVPHQPREAGEKLDLLRISARRGKQEEEHLARVTSGRAELDLVRGDGDKEERGVYAGDRRVRDGHALPEDGGVKALSVQEGSGDLRSIPNGALVREVPRKHMDRAFHVGGVQPGHHELGP